MSPPSTGSNSGSDLEDLGLGDSATAEPGINSSALQDDVSTAQDLMCHSGSPLSPTAATKVGVSLVQLPPQPYQPKMSYPKQDFGKQQRSLSMAWYKQYPWLHYLPENDTVLCYYCAKSVQLKMPLSGHGDKTFTEIGFRNW